MAGWTSLWIGDLSIAFATDCLSIRMFMMQHSGVQLDHSVNYQSLTALRLVDIPDFTCGSYKTNVTGRYFNV